MNSDLYLKMINYTNSSKLQDIFNKLKNTQQRNDNDIALMQENLGLLSEEYSNLAKERDDIDKKSELLRDAEQNKQREKSKIKQKYKPILTYTRIGLIPLELICLILSLSTNFWGLIIGLIICLGLHLGTEITVHVLKKKEYRKFLKELEAIAMEDLEGQKKTIEDNLESINQQYNYIKELINGKMQEQEEIDASLKQANYHFDEMQKVIDDLEQGLEEPVKLTRKKSE